MEDGWGRDTGCTERVRRKERAKARTQKEKERGVKEKGEYASIAGSRGTSRAIAQTPIHTREYVPVVGTGDIRPSTASTPRGSRTWKRTGM